MIMDLSEVFEARQHRYWRRNPARDRSIFHPQAVGLRTPGLRAIVRPETPPKSGLRLEFPAKFVPGSAWRVSRIKT
jgi:hypothetical protein